MGGIGVSAPRAARGYSADLVSCMGPLMKPPSLLILTGLADGQGDDALRDLRDAVRLEDALSYGEPADWFFPVRHLLGVELLRVGKPREAECVYREDLKRHPGNGWALYGLMQALKSVRPESSRLPGQGISAVVVMFAVTAMPLMTGLNVTTLSA